MNDAEQYKIERGSARVCGEPGGPNCRHAWNEAHLDDPFTKEDQLAWEDETQSRSRRPWSDGEHPLITDPPDPWLTARSLGIITSVVLAVLSLFVCLFLPGTQVVTAILTPVTGFAAYALSQVSHIGSSDLLGGPMMSKRFAEPDYDAEVELAEEEPTIPIPTTSLCGGCRGQGAHNRWCETQVGRSAQMFGRWSELCQELADSIGSHNMGAANRLYAAAGDLLAQAEEARDRFQANPGVYR